MIKIWNSRFINKRKFILL